MASPPKTYPQGHKIMQDTVGAVLKQAGHPHLLLQILAAAKKDGKGVPTGVNIVSCSIARLFWGVNDGGRVAYLGAQVRADEDFKASNLKALESSGRSPRSYLGLQIKSNTISENDAKALHASLVVALFGSYDKMVTAAVDTCVGLCTIPAAEISYRARELIYEAKEWTALSLDWCRFVVLNTIICYATGTHFGPSISGNIDTVGEYIRSGRTQDNLFEPRSSIVAHWGKETRDLLVEIATSICEVTGEDMEKFSKAIKNKDKQLSHKYSQILRLTWVESLSRMENAPGYTQFIARVTDIGLEWKSRVGLVFKRTTYHIVTNREVKQIAKYDFEHPDWTRAQVLSLVNKWAAKEDLRPLKPGRTFGSYMAIYTYRRRQIEAYKDEFQKEAQVGGDMDTDEDIEDGEA